MYFEDFKKIPEISKKTNCVIFVLPKELEVTIPRALVLRPEEKSVITVEQVRGILSKVSTKQLSDQFIVIRPAEKLSEVATNAFQSLQSIWLSRGSHKGSRSQTST